MSSPGARGELGAVWINVVPSLAGSQEAARVGGAAFAEGTAKAFKDRLGDTLPRAMEDVLLAGSRTMGPSLLANVLGGGDIRSAVRGWAQQIQTELNAVGKEFTLPLGLVGPLGKSAQAAASEMAADLKVQAAAFKVAAAERLAEAKAADAAYITDRRASHALMEAEELASQKRMREVGVFGPKTFPESAINFGAIKRAHARIEAEERQFRQRMGALPTFSDAAYLTEMTAAARASTR